MLIAPGAATQERVTTCIVRPKIVFKMMISNCCLIILVSRFILITGSAFQIHGSLLK